MDTHCLPEPSQVQRSVDFETCKRQNILALKAQKKIEVVMILSPDFSGIYPIFFITLIFALL